MMCKHFDLNHVWDFLRNVILIFFAFGAMRAFELEKNSI